MDDQPPLRVDPRDEGAHPADPDDRLWSESYYLDAISDDGSLGLYVRLGDTRNQDVSLVSLAIIGPDRAPIILNDGQAPLPVNEGSSWTVTSPDYTLTFDVTSPVEEFRVVFDGEARTHDDDRAFLRGEAGRPTRVAADLVWTNAGIDYQWKVSTRYEIPSHVTGTLSIDGEEFTFSGPGQRDHSWGSRDWWGHEWLWSAFQLDDGALVHAVNMRDTEWCFGYYQHHGALTELVSGRASQAYDGDGRISGSTIRLNEVDLDIEVSPIAYGSLLLVSEEGRRAHFIRAMADFAASDGRRGRGWIEWEYVVD